MWATQSVVFCCGSPYGVSTMVWVSQPLLTFLSIVVITPILPLVVEAREKLSTEKLSTLFSVTHLVGVKSRFELSK